MKFEVMFFNDSPGNCLTTFKMIGKNQYYNRHYDGGWYVAEPSLESSHKASYNIVFEVVDFDRHILFSESNRDLGAFQSINAKAKEFAQDWASRLFLKPYEQWQNWLLRDKPDSVYRDNWLYGDAITEDSGIIVCYRHLGITFRLEDTLMRHEKANKRWHYYPIVNMRSGNTTEICGYQFPDD